MSNIAADFEGYTTSFSFYYFFDQVPFCYYKDKQNRISD